MAEFDLKKVDRNDLGVMGAGVLAFIVSFMPFYTAKVSVAGFSASASHNAWWGYAVLGLLLIFAAAGVVAARVFGNVKLATLPLGWSVIVAGAAALGTLLLLLRGLTGGTGMSGSGYSEGFGWGGYVLLIVGVAQVVFAVMGMKASGEKIAWAPATPAAGAADAPAAPVAPPVAPPAPPVPPVGTAGDPSVSEPQG